LHRTARVLITLAMATVIGKKAPAFEALATGDKTIKLADLKGKKIFLYFYPKDSTSGCTKEGCAFRDNMSRVKRAGAVVLGVSRDSIASHEKFKKAQAFNFELLSDKDETLCNAYGVIKDKTMYGKKVRGIERSTFLIDEGGVLRKEWRGVKVDGHVDEVIDALKEL
jgi:thioredoxin-dependent peroxiredoxin